MKFLLSVASALSILVVVSWAAPATLLEAENSFISPINDQDPLMKEISALSTSASQDIRLRNRRSLEMLRKLCPDIFEVIDLVIQNVTSTVFRVVGGVLLRSGGLGGGGRSGGSSVSVVLPTFPPDEDDDEDEDEEEEEDANKIDSDAIAKKTTTTSTTEDTNVTDNSSSANLSISFSSTLNDESELNRQIRTAREAQDQDAASSNVAPAPENDLSNVDTDDADRDKRYSAFGGDSQGSGNFLFDLVRLITGSGAQTHDAGAGGVAEIDVSPRAESAEGIPGPITRLLVVANRGIANLIQDLILRLAQTSERIVNFKARLITALI